MLILKWRIARGSNSSRESGRGFVSTVESTLLIRCTRSTKRSFITQLPKNGSLEGSLRTKCILKKSMPKMMKLCETLLMLKVRITSYICHLIAIKRLHIHSNENKHMVINVKPAILLYQF